jgi:type II secretory pathway predicted ATPase ExeA
MYERFYGFKVKPFALLPQEEFMFLSRQHSTALALLTYSLHNRAMFCVVCGDIGTGKTTLLRYLLSRHEPHITVGMITSTIGTFAELLPWVLSEFGLDYRGLDKIGMQHELVAYFKRLQTLGKRAVLVIDEAQALTPDVLEELRLFSNINAGRTMLLQTVLVGQLSLRDTLRRPELRQLAQRVAVDYLLTPLDREQTEAYIYHRLHVAGIGREGVFTAEACDAVYAASGGIPRVINLLCDTALAYGFAGQEQTIEAATVAEVLADRQRGAVVNTEVRAAGAPARFSTGTVSETGGRGA